MRLEQFEYLIEISKNHSLSAAAQKLYLTPQALSMSISAMEEELHLTLLERSFKGVNMTTDGNAIVEAAKIFLNSLSAIQNQNNHAFPALKGDYILFSIYGEINYFLLKLLSHVFQDIPGFNLSINRQPVELLVTLLRTDKTEIAMTFATVSNQLSPLQYADDILFYPLLPCRLYAQIPKTLPIAVYKTLSLKTLLDYPLIFFKEENSPEPYTLQLLRSIGTPKQVILKSSNALCHELLSVGAGVSLHLAIQGHTLDLPNIKDVVYLPIRDNLQFAYGYLQKKEHTLSPTTENLISYIRTFSDTL